MILIQEPYIFRDPLRRITKRISSYECFSPVDNWTLRPRVLTYLRKGAGLHASQRMPLPANNTAARDLLLLDVTGPMGRNLSVYNVYNAPPGSENVGEAVKALIQYTSVRPRDRTFLAGDFNIRHFRWQPSAPHNGPTADTFVEWIDENFLLLTTEPDRPTHTRGNVLDLTFMSNQLASAGAESAIVLELNVTSDHYPIASTVPWDDRFHENIARLRPETLDKERFLYLLERGLTGGSQLTDNCSTDEIDTAASELCTKIINSYCGAVRRTLGKGTGHPRWNDECKVAA
ncbi:hypothetical protein K3495_g4797 [Podosphaera aphanis]|nr:hypothetical protein K3495_g4797 [Podosphaera aphanis]